MLLSNSQQDHVMPERFRTPAVVPAQFVAVISVPGLSLYDRKKG